MSRCRACEPSARGPRAPTLPRRALGLARWAAPGVTLALMPKCPACFAAYIAIWTGVGLSFTAAYYLRLALIIFCTASLAYLAAAYLRRRFIRSAQP